jgi:hypothetical protein
VRGLTNAERAFLQKCEPPFNHEDSNTPEEEAIGERLVARGLLHEVEDVDPTPHPDPAFEWVDCFYIRTPLGELALRCDFLARRIYAL